MAVAEFLPTTWEHVPWDSIRRVSTLLYDIELGGWILPRADGVHRVPAGTRRPGEDLWRDTLVRVPLEAAGFRLTAWFPFAVAGDHLAIWCDGRRDRAASAKLRLWCGASEPAAELLSGQVAGVDPVSAQLIRMAERSRVEKRDEMFFAANSWVIEPIYLAGETPQARSGFGGSDEQWRAAREMLCDALPGDCTFLDVGCANGYLVESLVRWAAERGVAVEPYGVDISDALVAEARSRLPHWADRFFVGNALEWRPPRGERFDVVHTMVDYVPEHTQGALVKHLLDATVSPRGRLVISAYADDGQVRENAADIVRRLGFAVSGVTRPGIAPDGRPVPSAWIEKT